MISKQLLSPTLTIGVAAVLLSACQPPAGEADTDGSPTAAPADRFVELSRGEEATAEDWFALAQSAREAGDIATATEALDLAAAELPATRVTLERARASVAQNEPGLAVETLQTLFESGFTGVRLLTDDAVLSSLAGNTAFDALIDTMSRQAYPCEYDARFSEFDFWVGSWDVHVAGGQRVGSNRIEREERSCLLTEHWTNTSGGTGTSINYVDKTTDEWVQVWNSEGGAQINIRGGLTDEGMRLVGTIHYVANATTAPFRGLWTPLDDGRVRQYFEQSNDGGDTWVPWFEGFYSHQDVAGH